MQKYTDIVLSNGRPVTGAVVTVTTYPGGAAPTIFADNGVTVIAGNSVSTDTSGRFSFYAADGRYTLTISGTGITTQTISDILLEDPTNPNPIAATTITATGTATLAGVTATSLAVSGAATCLLYTSDAADE